MSAHRLLVPLPEPRRFEYLPGLDGVRALAVVAVVLYHAGVSWMPGGLLGVDTFFVLSGYLITALLVREWWDEGSISILAFWKRRALRLLPAVGGLIAGVSIVLVFLRSGMDGFLGELAGVLLYVYNWVLIGRDVSYFESMGRPSPVGHMWSLAVEEQFYVLWPLVVVAVLATGRRTGRGNLLVVATLGATLSTLLMAALFVPGADPSRVYLGTDTRMTGLLVGAAGAVLWHPGRTLAPQRRRTLDVVGLIGLAGLVAAFLLLDEYTSMLYRGGFGFVSLLSLVVVIAAADRESLLGHILDRPILRWLGTRSYSIYLWHWPVMVFMRPAVDIPLDGPPALAMQMLMTGALAELSFRHVERRRRAGAERVVAPAATVSSRPLVYNLARSWPVVVAAGLVLGIWATQRLEPTTIRPLPPLAALTMPGAPQPTEAPALDPPVPSSHAGAAGGRSTEDAPGVTATTPSSEPPPSATTTMPAHRPDVIAVGDSVMAGAIGELEQVYGRRIRVDADEGRTVPQGVELIERMARWHRLRSVVVVHLGNNGPITADDIARIMRAAGRERRVIFLTVRLPRRWEDRVNDVLRSEVPTYPNARLLDWHEASAGRREWFAGDGVHVVFTPGADAYARLITTAALEAS